MSDISAPHTRHDRNVIGLFPKCLATLFVLVFIGVCAGSASAQPEIHTAQEAIPWPAPALAKEGVPQVQPQPLVWEVVVKSQHMGSQHVVFVLPPDYHTKPDARWPAVLAFAGLGESKRGNKAGAWGWVEKYGVIPAMAALHRNTLTSEDFQGLVKGNELEAYNAVLTQQPYQGVILVCPYPPQRVTAPYERYIMEELLPYTEQHLRVFSEPERWGIDGISMGGMLSTWIGFRYPERFGAFGSQQSSVGYSARLKTLVDQKLPILQKKRINIATSDRDGFRRSLTQLSERLDAGGLPHRFTILPGRHDKRFVKGPGSIELLLFHDRALWGSGEMPPEVRKR